MSDEWEGGLSWGGGWLLAHCQSLFMCGLLSLSLSPSQGVFTLHLLKLDSTGLHCEGAWALPPLGELLPP